MTKPAQTFPEIVAELHRLVAVAHQQRVYLVQDGHGAWYARSTLDASAHHFLTGFSCTCPVFITDHACPHHALLLARLGWLPPPAPIAWGDHEARAPPQARQTPA